MRRMFTANILSKTEGAYMNEEHSAHTDMDSSDLSHWKMTFYYVVTENIFKASLTNFAGIALALANSFDSKCHLSK